MRKILVPTVPAFPSAAFLAALFLGALVAGPAQAQNTAFTYQGSLDDAGTPTNGLHDFRFRLFDAASGGTLIGTALCVDNVNVVNGVFTAQLDFGQQFATAGQRHLEIDVRRDTGLSCADATGFVVMAPRQQLTATPLASHANSAFALDAADGSPANAVFVDDGGNVGIGTTAPTTKLDVRGGAMLVENLGDQADLLWLASERSWVFRQEGAGSAAALKLENIGGGGNKNFIVQTTGLVGVGTTAPLAKLDVRGDIRMGTSGQYQATGGTENLRLLRGRISGSGSILQGSGFTAARVLPGWYTVTFAAPFTAVPTVIATAVSPSGTQQISATCANHATNVVVVHLRNNSNVGVDNDFDFIVVGPR